MIDEERWLGEVVARATANVVDSSGPFAAMVIRDGAVVADGVNRVTRDGDPFEARLAKADRVPY